MIPASVGFQCPDDVRDGNKGMRRAAPRTLAGGVMSARPGSITIGLIVINVLLFLVQQASPTFTGRFVLWGSGVERGEYYRLITAAFLHASIQHVAFNMFSLYVIGTQVERLLGTTRFLAVYLVSALAGTVASFALQPSAASSLGASGAIFGLLGALLVIVRRLHLDAGPILGMLGLNLVFTFLVPGIDWRAHIGGLIAGALLTWAFSYAPQSARRWAHPAAVVSLLAVLALVVQTRVHEQHALLGSSTPVAQPFGTQSVDDVR
jgi:membrane associated rhomboid family serine protease